MVKITKITKRIEERHKREVVSCQTLSDGAV